MHDSQSWSQSAPSIAGSTFGNRAWIGVFSGGVPGAGVDAPEIVCRAVLRKDLRAVAIVFGRLVDPPLAGSEAVL